MFNNNLFLNAPKKQIYLPLSVKPQRLGKTAFSHGMLGSKNFWLISKTLPFQAMLFPMKNLSPKA